MKLKTIDTINRCLKTIRILIVAILILILAASIFAGCNKNNAAGNSRMNELFEYDGEELVQSINTSSREGTPVVKACKWFFYDQISSGSGVMACTYYTDMPWQSGDYLFLCQPTIRGSEILTFPQSRYIPCNINETTT